MTAFVGRTALVETLAAEVRAGHTVLVHGQRWVGKTTLLREVLRAVRPRPSGWAVRTQELRDVTAGLTEAYPDAVVGARTQRQLRQRLLRAAERAPGLLILDHLRHAGTALKGLVRALDGTGMGVLVAVDVEHAEDHARARAFHVSYREQPVPPLATHEMRQVLEEALSLPALRLPPLTEAHRAALLRIAAGRPGALAFVLRRLAEGHGFLRGQLLTKVLWSDVFAAVAAYHLASGDSGDHRGPGTLGSGAGVLYAAPGDRGAR